MADFSSISLLECSPFQNLETTSSNNLLRKKLGRPCKSNKSNYSSGRWNKDEQINFYVCCFIHVQYKIEWKILRRFLCNRTLTQIINKFSGNQSIKKLNSKFWETNQFYLADVDKLLRNISLEDPIDDNTFLSIRIKVINFLTKEEIIDKTYLFTITEPELKSLIIPSLESSGETVEQLQTVKGIYFEMTEEIYSAIKMVNSNSSEFCLFNFQNLATILKILAQQQEKEEKDYQQC